MRSSLSAGRLHSFAYQGIHGRTLKRCRDICPARVELPLGFALRTSSMTAVFKPLKLKSKPGLLSIGRGRSKAESSPLSASFASAGPPG